MQQTEDMILLLGGMVYTAVLSGVTMIGLGDQDACALVL